MDCKLELIVIPVTDVDRARAFYEGIGFVIDHDRTVHEALRFVQATPRGSACSIAFGRGLTEAEPGSVKGLQVVVDDIDVARDSLVAAGHDVAPVDHQPWGDFVFFADPDGNHWSVQCMAKLKA